jgi:hypothetical protein
MRIRTYSVASFGSGALTTREFTHQSYMNEISSNINGYPVFPPHNADFAPGSLRVINIHVSAENLSNGKFFTNTDPLCTLFIQGPHGWQEYGRTEVCWNIVNPLWIRPFTYHVRDGPQLLMFSIFDIICDSLSLSQQRPLGDCQLDLAALLGSPDQFVDLEIFGPSTSDAKGVLHVHFYDIAPCQGSLFFRFSLKNLTSHLRKPNPFFVIQRLSPKGNAWISIYKSKVIAGKATPEWDRVELSLQFLCGGDLQRLIRIQVYDCKNMNTDNLIGFADTSVEILIGNADNLQLCDSNGKKTGVLSAVLIQHWTGPRLFDLRLRGVQLGTMLAIDFSSTSINAVTSNRVAHTEVGVFSYHAAINDTCDLLHPLTMGQPYLAYGFADFPGPEKLVSLTMGEMGHQRDFIPNLKRVIQLYSQAKQKTMYPNRACVAPVVRKAREVAQMRWAEERTITILVILTNGRFCDLQEGIDEVVNAQFDPLCVIMVVMGGTRRELNNAFKHKHGLISDSAGNRTKRRVISIGSYLEQQIYPDERLPQKLAPAAKKMARQWLELIHFEPPSIHFGPRN